MCTTSINDTGGKFASSVNDISGKFAAGVNYVYTCGKFATGVFDTGDIGTISDCWNLQVNLKKKFICRLTLVRKGVQKKLLKLFWLKVFSICHPPCTLSCNISINFWKKNGNRPNGRLRTWGKLIHEKNLKLKILWHCPFKLFIKSKQSYIQGELQRGTGQVVVASFLEADCFTEVN